MTIDPRHAHLMTPRGTRDFLPGEAARKSALEQALRETFRRWGYREVITPTVEFLETVMQSNGQDGADPLYRLFDREGNTLALRPELTTPIARIAATRLKAEPRPVRLQYVANVFRHETMHAGRQREFWQAGVELLGASGPGADAEVVALAVEALHTAGLPAFRVEIGHVGYFNGLLNGLAVPTEVRRRLRRALLARDYVDYERALAEVRPGADAEDRTWRRLQDVPRLRGGPDAIARALAEADDDESRAAAQDVAAIYEALVDYGVHKWVAVDFGLIKDLDYYTGMVLEGYTEGIGFPVCTGGRYDNLIGRFGADMPATGFVLGVERVLAALVAQGASPWNATTAAAPDVLLVYDEAGRPAALAAARRLRAQGQVVEVDVAGRDEAGARAYARSRGIPDVALMFGGKPVVRLAAPTYEAKEAMTWP